jgi:NADH-quinone oxidoreductase subunit H
MSGMIDSVLAVWESLPEMLRFVLVVLFKIVVVLLPLILSVAYFTYWERKILAWMHVRMGPNRVGWKGLLQPFADVIKMLLKEIVVPTNSNKFLFLIAPILSLVPALAVWAVLVFFSFFVIY